jgi:hypothetical protein
MLSLQTKITCLHTQCRYGRLRQLELACTGKDNSFMQEIEFIGMTDSVSTEFMIENFLRSRSWESV